MNQEILKQDDEDATVGLQLYHMGSAYEREGDIQMAITYYNKALKLCPDLYATPLLSTFKLSANLSLTESSLASEDLKFSLKSLSLNPRNNAVFSTGWNGLPFELQELILQKLLSWHSLFMLKEIMLIGPHYRELFSSESNQSFWKRILHESLSWKPSWTRSRQEKSHLEAELLTYTYLKEEVSLPVLQCNYNDNEPNLVPNYYLQFKQIFTQRACNIKYREHQNSV